MDLASIIRGYDGRRGKFLSALRAYPLADVRSLPAVKKPLILAILKLAHELKDSAEERKIVRHLYTLCSVSADGLGSDARIAAIELLCKTGTEINHPNALRQAAALRALAALLHSAPSDAKALALNAASTAVLVVAKHLSLPQKPTKKVRRAHAEACIVSHAILYVLIAGASRAPAHVNFAADCLRSADADLARCACAYLADCAQSRARTVAAALHPIIGFLDKKLKHDTAAYVSWINICAAIAMRQANEVDAVADFFSVAGEQSASANESDASENEVSFEIADAFKISLSSAALSSSAELRSEAIVLLSKLPWQELCGMKTPAASGGGVHTSLLSSIIEKMDLGTDRGMPSVGCPPHPRRDVQGDGVARTLQGNECACEE